MKEKLLEQITSDLAKIKDMVDDGIKYSYESIEDIQKRVAYNSQLVLSKQIVEVGEWAQIHSGGREPFYAKISNISKDGFAVLEGIYNYEGKDLDKRRPNSFPLDVILPVSEELGRLLEFSNGNNKMGMSL